MLKIMQQRKTPYSKLYKHQVLPGGISMLIPIVNDLDDDMLRWHFNRAIDEEDYEYAQHVAVEAERRKMILKV